MVGGSLVAADCVDCKGLLVGVGVGGVLLAPMGGGGCTVLVPVGGRVCTLLVPVGVALCEFG